MQFVRALKFRIYPTKSQQLQIDDTLACCRFVYNKMIERNSKAYKRRGEHLSHYEMQNLLPSMKQYLPWLKDTDSQALKHACKQVDSAYRNFFKKNSRYPKFKSKKDGKQSYTTTYAKSICYEVGKVKIPKLGWVKHSDNREVKGDICYATVIRDGSKYYISITYKFEKEIEQVIPQSFIGLDYKSDGLYMDSEGNIANMPKWMKQSQDKVAKEQRKLERKQGSRKGEKRSNNYTKQLKRLQKKHRHIANQRKDFLHKKSTEIANQYDFVAVEDLNLIGIAKVLGKATLDNGYGMFLKMLQYKLEERGKTFVKVGRYFPSSQLCSSCGYKNPLVRDLKIRDWVCPECGVVHDRDVNSALNILNEGLRIAS